MAKNMYPKFTVTMSDGAEHFVQVENPDMCRLEIIGGRNGFTLDDQKIVSMTYLAFANMKRHGVYTGTWDEFKDSDCLGFDALDEDEDEDEDSDPKD